MKKRIIRIALYLLIIFIVVLASYVLRPKNHFYTVDILNKKVTVFNNDKDCIARYLVITNYEQNLAETNIELNYVCPRGYPMSYNGDSVQVSTIDLEKVTPFIHIYTAEEGNYTFSLFSNR